MAAKITVRELINKLLGCENLGSEVNVQVLIREREPNNLVTFYKVVPVKRVGVEHLTGGEGVYLIIYDEELQAAETKPYR